jgi:TolB-like protein
MKRRIICLAILLIFLTMPLLAQVKIAVLEFTGKNVSEADASALTDRLRLELFRTKKFNVIEREIVDEILKEQGFQLDDLSSDQSIIEIGRILGVEQMVAGSVSRVGNVYSIAARIISVQTAEIIQIATLDHEGAIGTLLKSGMKMVADELAGLKPPEEPETPGIVQKPTTTRPKSTFTPRTTLTSEKKMRFGVIGGLNVATVYGDDVADDVSTVTGAAFGGFVIIPIMNNLNLRPEILFSMKGFSRAEYYLDDGWGNYYWVKSYSESLNYLEIPILAEIVLPLGGLSLNLLTGISIGLNVGANWSMSYEDDYGYSYSENGDDDTIKAIDTGFILGGGLIVVNRLYFDMRFNIGLTGVCDDPDYDYKIMNMVMSMMFGFCFN